MPQPGDTYEHYNATTKEVRTYRWVGGGEQMPHRLENVETGDLAEVWVLAPPSAGVSGWRKVAA